MSATAATSAPDSEVPRGYPAAFELNVKTATGTTVHVRPILPDDGPRLAAFHQSLSPRTVYLRFFRPHPRLSDQELHRFTHVDYADRLALVAEIDERIIAVARYDRAAGTREAEVAFVVADEWQHHGIAPSLLKLLARAAWLCGIDTFKAATLPDNTDMLHVFLHSGYQPTTHIADGVVEVRFPIAPPFHRDTTLEPLPPSLPPAAC